MSITAPDVPFNDFGICLQFVNITYLKMILVTQRFFWKLRKVNKDGSGAFKVTTDN